MTLSALVAFVGITTLAYVTPGPDWFVVMRNAARSRRAGLISGVGVSCGLLVHMTAAAVGVAALLLSSAEAFTALKLIGAGYLLYLGVRSLIASRRTHDGHADVDHPPASGWSVFRQSFVANVLNPKAALFFVAVLPQFLTPHSAVAPQVLLLGAIDVVMGLAWWALFVYGISRVQRVLDGGRSRRIIDRVAGVGLIGLGAGLAFLKPTAAIAH